MDRLIDISEAIAPATAVWPGDTVFQRRWVMEMTSGAAVNVSTITMSTHCGSHADAPFHYLPDGKSIDQVDLSAYIGPCRVVQVKPVGSPRVVPVSELAACRGATRVLLRTLDQHDATRFDVEFSTLGIEAARHLIGLGVRLVGIDTPSMDHFSCKDMATHRALLGGGVAILENLDLSRAAPGDYELIALPLKILGSDAAPVRAVLRPLWQTGR